MAVVTKTEKAREETIFYTVAYDQIRPLPADLDTVPKAFIKSARQYGERFAMRKKRMGIWQEYTWAQSLDVVKHLCLGLVSLGLKRGDKVAIIGENDPEFYWAQYAVHAAGGTTAAIFTDAIPPELQFVATHSDSVFIFAHDQEQVDKALEIRDALPNVRRVIYWEDRGLWNYEDPWLLRFEDLQKLGRDYARTAAPSFFDDLVGEGTASEYAIFSYTSGTSGLPKAAMVTHGNLLYNSEHNRDHVETFPGDDYVSFSPLAWITEQTLGYGGHALFGFTVNFPEGPETVQTDLREIAPSTLLFPSRIWENLARTMQMRISDSSLINRVLYKLFMPVAYKVIDLEDERQPIPAGTRALRFLGEYAIFQPLRDKIGMSRMRHAFTSGAVLSPDVLRFFRAVGVELKNIYGSTEIQAGCQHYAGGVKLASVGVPVPGVQIKIAEDGEIRVKSRAVFAGYYKDDKKTEEAFDEEGFFRTGDAGYVDDDGHLIYLDRVKDMIQLANGESFSPQYIEGRLKFSPYIQDVMAVGGFDMPFVTAIIIIDFENMSRWAEKNRVNFTTYVDLTQKQETYDLVLKEIRRVNETLPRAARLRKFVILHKAFDADEAELTRTRKLRRKALEERYGDMLDAMYTDKDSVRVVAEVKYRDGRTGTVETDVRVATV
jgi:long-chain acyl-CoA synthetase